MPFGCDGFGFADGADFCVSAPNRSTPPAPVTIAQFRTDFAEFGDSAAYPDARVQIYLALAQSRLDPVRWSDLWTYGVELYTAHSLALAKMRATTVPGSAPGVTTGVKTSSSVGGVSKSVDISSVTIEGAGTYNLTSYGSEYYQLMRQIGIGGLQL